MTKQADRITLIQEAHPWMLEREARGLLVAMYAALRSLGAEDMEEQMDECVERIREDSRKGVELAISKLPPHVVAAEAD